MYSGEPVLVAGTKYFGCFLVGVFAVATTTMIGVIVGLQCRCRVGSIK